MLEQANKPCPTQNKHHRRPEEAALVFKLIYVVSLEDCLELILIFELEALTVPLTCLKLGTVLCAQGYIFVAHPFP